MLFKFLSCRTRWTRWSCSRLSHWLVEKYCDAKNPSLARTIEEWNTYEKQTKTANRFVYWLAHDFMTFAQDIVYFPADVWYTIRVYVVNRYFDKLHVLQTKLEPGKYYDYDERLLHGMFNSYVQFIEEDLGVSELQSQIVWHQSQDTEHQDEQERECTSIWLQHAREEMALYRWWKFDRPARINSYQASGMKSFYDKRPDRGILELEAVQTDEDNTEYSACSKKWREIDKDYDQEDEDMMIRLVKLRRSLWT